MYLYSGESLYMNWEPLFMKKKTTSAMEWHICFERHSFREVPSIAGPQVYPFRSFDNVVLYPLYNSNTSEHYFANWSAIWFWTSTSIQTNDWGCGKHYVLLVFGSRRPQRKLVPKWLATNFGAMKMHVATPKLPATCIYLQVSWRKLESCLRGRITTPHRGVNAPSQCMYIYIYT